MPSSAQRIPETLATFGEIHPREAAKQPSEGSLSYKNLRATLRTGNLSVVPGVQLNRWSLKFSASVKLGRGALIHQSRMFFLPTKATSVESRAGSPPSKNMSDYHRIRLRDPWQREPLSHSVRFHRAFNRPTGLKPTTHIELVLDQVHIAGDVYLNGEHLGSFMPDSQPVRFNISGSLGLLNELHMVVETGNSRKEGTSGRTKLSVQQLKSLECVVDEVRLEISECQ